MKYPTENRRGPWVGLGARALVYVSLACGALYGPSALEAQQAERTSGSKDTAAGQKPPQTPADSAACAQVITYAFQHPEVLQKGEELRASGKTKQLSTLPDSMRTRIGAAIAKGQNDSLKAMAHVIDPQGGDSLYPLIDFVTAFPDSVRTAVATLVASGRPMTCE